MQGELEEAEHGEGDQHRDDEPGVAGQRLGVRWRLHGDRGGGWTNGWNEKRGASELGPLTQKVVIDAGEGDDGRVRGVFRAEALDRDIHLEEQAALRIAADHRLDPEE